MTKADFQTYYQVLAQRSQNLMDAVMVRFSNRLITRERDFEAILTELIIIEQRDGDVGAGAFEIKSDLQSYDML